MAHSSVAAAHVGKHTMPLHRTKGHKMCARCGRVREARQSSPLCSDCKYVLSAEECQAWLPKSTA